MYILCINQLLKLNKLLQTISKIKQHCCHQGFNHKHLMYVKFRSSY